MAGDFDIGPADWAEDNMSENGKGDTPRPISVGRSEYERRWAQTFDGMTQDEVDDKRRKELAKHMESRVWINGVLVKMNGKPVETLGDPEE